MPNSQYHGKVRKTNTLKDIKKENITLSLKDGKGCLTEHTWTSNYWQIWSFIFPEHRWATSQSSHYTRCWLQSCREWWFWYHTDNGDDNVVVNENMRFCSTFSRGIDIWQWWWQCYGRKRFKIVSPSREAGSAPPLLAWGWQVGQGDHQTSWSS